MNKHTIAKGDISEFKVGIWAIENGYSISYTTKLGPVDIILYNEKEILYVDVKTATYRSGSWQTHALTPFQIKHNIGRILYFSDIDLVVADHDDIVKPNSSCLNICNLERLKDWDKIKQWMDDNNIKYTESKNK